MRLLRTSSVTADGDQPLVLDEFFGSCPTWAKDPRDEVLYKDVESNTAREKKAFRKLELTADQAKLDGYLYIWIDTCCIDKSSSAELQEAINSMYQWYQGAADCYVYLEDIADGAEIKRSRWFTRGWTLQELLAPQKITFFSTDWEHLGRIDRAATRRAREDGAFLPAPTRLVMDINEVTSISGDILLGLQKVSSSSIGTRMSWAANRQTTRREDLAYCLLGILDVNMTLLYGEGDRAFLRLQEEIMRRCPDSTIFLWDRHRNSYYATGTSLIASEPFAFRDWGAFDHGPVGWLEAPPFTMTSLGLQIRLPLIPIDQQDGLYLGILNCTRVERGKYLRYSIYLRIMNRSSNMFHRVHHQRLVSFEESAMPRDIMARTTIFSPWKFDDSTGMGSVWDAANRRYVEDIAGLRINSTGLSDGFGLRSCLQRTDRGWEPAFADRQAYGNSLTSLHTERFDFKLVEKGPGSAVAICIVPSAAEGLVKRIWIVFSRHSDHITIVAWDQDCGAATQREQFIIVVEQVYGYARDTETGTRAGASRSKRGTADTGREVELCYQLKIERRSHPWSAGKERWLWSEDLRFHRPTTNRDRIPEAVDESESLPVMLDSMTACRFPEAPPRRHNFEHRKACSCCISLRPSSEVRESGEHVAEYAEVIAHPASRFATSPSTY